MKKNLAYVLCLGALALGGTAAAMPTKQELAKVQPEVTRALEAKRALYVKGKAGADTVADYALELISEVASDAERFLLYRDAIAFYARAGAHDKAVAAAEKLQEAVKDIPDETFLALLKDALVKARRDGGALAAYYGTRREQAARAKKVVEAKAAYEKKRDDPVLRTLYAESLALAGQWAEALPLFAQAGGVVGKTARSELDDFIKADGVTRRAAADFWWGYSVAGEPADKANGIKRHAAELYEKAIAVGELSGLAAKNISARIEKAVPRQTGAYDWRVPAGLKKPKSLAFKLESGRTVEFLACPAGSFMMSNFSGAVVPGAKAPKKSDLHKVTLTYPFWMMRENVTTRDWREFSPGSFEEFRKWEEAFPEGGNVSIYVRAFRGPALEYCAWMTEKYGKFLPEGWVFRLPTEAEFEYANRLGGVYCTPPCDLGSVGACWRKGVLPRSVGEKASNSSLPGDLLYKVYLGVYEPDMEKHQSKWGFLGMLALSASEAVLDTFDAPGEKDPFGGESRKKIVYQPEEVNPLRIATGPSARCISRHVAWVRGKATLPDQRHLMGLKWRGWGYGVRLVAGPDIEKITREGLPAAQK